MTIDVEVDVVIQFFSEIAQVRSSSIQFSKLVRLSRRGVVYRVNANLYVPSVDSKILTPFHLSNADLYMGFLQSQNPQYKKGGLSVKSNRCLITFKDTDPLGSAFEMLKGVKIIDFFYWEKE